MRKGTSKQIAGTGTHAPGHSAKTVRTNDRARGQSIKRPDEKWWQRHAGEIAAQIALCCIFFFVLSSFVDDYYFTGSDAKAQKRIDTLFINFESDLKYIEFLKTKQNFYEQTTK